MDNIKNDVYYIDRIRKDLQFISIQMKEVDIEELNQNEVLLDSMLFRMIQISENSKKLSDEYKENNNNIPWNEMYGLRTRIALTLYCVKDKLRYNMVVNRFVVR